MRTEAEILAEIRSSRREMEGSLLGDSFTSGYIYGLEWVLKRKEAPKVKLEKEAD